MSEQSLISRANELIRSDQLRPKAKAFLLLKLCQVHALLSSEKAEEFWQQLQSLQRHLENEDKKLLEELRPMIEEEEDPSKGFAGEKIAEIKAKLAEPELNEWELREFLEEKAEEVRKRIWPGGKQAVWEFLVQVWKTFDRKQALVLTAKLSNAKRQMVVQRMNRVNPLSVEEWRRLQDVTSKNEVIRIISAILEDPQPKLLVPSELIQPVVVRLSSNVTDGQISPCVEKINKFLPLVTNQENLPEVFEAIKATAKTFGTAQHLAIQWPEKFHAVLNLISLGTNLGVINKANANSFAHNLPSHMVDYALCSCYALFSASDDLETNLSEVMGIVSQKEQTEAWFLVLATQRGLGGQAYNLAKGSPNRRTLLPRICRAWLTNNPGDAAAVIEPEDIKDDFAAQILYRTDKLERVNFLREQTTAGTMLLPSCIWAAEKPLEEGKGFWGSLFSSGKTFDEIIQEYLKRNPLYVSYQRNTPPAQQFVEFLRINGYGEYNCKNLDPITLESLILWAKEYPEEVTQELSLMWKALEPDDDILKLDFLRNAIFERCTTVFAADPEFLNGEFIPWIKKKLVDNSLVWQWGKTQYTVRYPSDIMARMCMQGAIATQNISPNNRDKLVETALTLHPANDPLGELGAQLYNQDKIPLDVNLPWKTKSTVVDGWQIGIIKNAIPAIFQEVIQREAPQV